MEVDLLECTEVHCVQLNDLRVGLGQCAAQLFYGVIVPYDRVILLKNDVPWSRYGVR